MKRIFLKTKIQKKAKNNKLTILKKYHFIVKSINIYKVKFKVKIHFKYQQQIVLII